VGEVSGAIIPLQKAVARMTEGRQKRSIGASGGTDTV